MNPTTTEPPISPQPDFAEFRKVRSALDQTLTEIRSGRRLERVVSSIESFLTSQVARLDKAIEECNAAVENDNIVKRILADFEKEKAAWDECRQREILRLQRAGEELIKGWEQLEIERER